MSSTQLLEETPEFNTVEVAESRGLDEIWETRPGIIGWFSSVDHKAVGIRYLVTAFALLCLGGMEALIMRLQLAGPNEHLVTARQYNMLYSTHGMTMIFLYAYPILAGFSNYFWPLLLGARDMAFPRLNMLSYWIFLAAALFMYGGFIAGSGPNDGWFNYVPYSTRPYNPGFNIDIYSLGMIILGVSTTIGSANFLVSLVRCRAPGMSINRWPIIIWGTTTASAANIITVPAVSLAFFLLWMDRNFGTHFFDVPAGGQPLLWQHLFWMYAHPWVYAIVLPAMGIVSDALPVFCRRPLVGYVPVALSTVAAMMVGFGVWVHHMFTTGVPYLALSFISGASMIIVIPSAVTIFAWSATIWLGTPVITTASLFFISMIPLFVIGGVSGFMTGVVPADWQLHATYFVVAHIHYVLIGINLFPVMGGFYYWFPKMSGRMLGERLGRWNFWLMFAGFNIAFLPMHITGLHGMPRRIYTYPDWMGLHALNLVTTIGAFILAVGILLFIVNVFTSLRHGAVAGDNPWDAATLEWTTSSPPPPYNFAVVPIVISRHPLWEDRLQKSQDRSSLRRGLVLDRGRETVGVTVLDGEPNVILRMPGDTILPLIMTIGIVAGFAGLLVHLWPLAGAGTAVFLIVLGAWMWPRRELGQIALPPGGSGGHV